MILDELAIKYGTDKSSKEHNYARYYERHLRWFKDQPINLLEIGVQKGASLRMWREYFPKASIIGMDNADMEPMGEDINIVIGDQSKEGHLISLGQNYGPFDVIIDDGSHINHDVELSLRILFPFFLNSGGIYIIEDLHTLYWGNGFGEPTAIDRLKFLIDDINSRGKVGNADRKKNPQYINKEKQGMKTLSWWENNVLSMEIFRSIVFITKV